MQFDDEVEGHLAALEERFLKAVSLRQEGKEAEAAEELRSILKVEPRLPEPHLELGSILLGQEELEEAEEHTREGLRLLESGGQWNEEIPEPVMRSIAHGQLGEVLRRRCDTDEVIFGDAGVFKRLLKESRQHFDKAAELDPQNEHAAHFGMHLRLPGESEDLGEEEEGPDGEA